MAAVQRLIARYQRPDTGYAARRAVFETRYARDYDHLSRFGEWQMSDRAVAIPVGAPMVRDDASQRQVQRVAAQSSTWLMANAGSGKTRVLTDRVARLLLHDVEPQRILCLTYTKSAASEMQNRLFKTLGEWAMKPDAALRRRWPIWAKTGWTAPTLPGRAACLPGRSRRRAACASRRSTAFARRFCGAFRWRRACRRALANWMTVRPACCGRRFWKKWPMGWRRMRWPMWRANFPAMISWT